MSDRRRSFLGSSLTVHMTQGSDQSHCLEKFSFAEAEYEKVLRDGSDTEKLNRVWIDGFEKVLMEWKRGQDSPTVLEGGGGDMRLDGIHTIVLKRDKRRFRTELP